MPSAPLFSAAGEKSGEFELPASIWGEKARVDLVHQAIETELHNRRQGTSSTKKRSEVRGGGRKPYRQKGTGRARQGSTRAPHFRHGGVVHGPEPRNLVKKMPQKMRRLAFRSALSAKATDGGIRVIEALETAAISTRQFAAWLDKLAPGEKTVLVLSARDENTILSARNLPGVRVIVLPGLSTYEVVRAETLILTREAVQKLDELYSDTRAEVVPAPAAEEKPAVKPRARAKKSEVAEVAEAASEPEAPQAVEAPAAEVAAEAEPDTVAEAPAAATAEGDEA